MNANCIFCLKDNDLTDEHIIPDSIGGSLQIHAVCKKCNSEIGRDIDGVFINSLLISLPRFALQVPGKSGAVPNPFGGVGTSSDGYKVRMDDNLKPKILPTTQEETTPGGDIEIKMVFDKSDEACVSSEVLKKARRVLRQKYPKMQEPEIEKKAQASLDDALERLTMNDSNPTVQYKFSINLAAMRLEFIKIAYEMAFYVFGENYVSLSKTAAVLRKAIVERQSEPMVHGQIPCAPDHFGLFFPESDKHVVLMLNGGAYIRLFGIAGFVEFEESDARFMCPGDAARVFMFNFKDRTHSEEPFLHRLMKAATQQGLSGLPLLNNMGGAPCL